MRRRQLLTATAALLSGCTSEVTVRQPTPTVDRVERYGSDKNIKVTIRAAAFERSNCRFRVAGSFTDIQWPTQDVTLFLFLYDDDGIVITSRERLFERVAPGQVIEFEMEAPMPDCERPAGYEVIGRRIQR